MFLAAVPGAYQAQLLTRLLDDTVIAHPSPLPATAGRGTLVLHMMPQGCEEILPAVLPLPHPLLLGQSAQYPRGQVLVPNAHLGQLVGGPAAQHRGEHHSKDLTQQLRLGLQPPLDLDRQGLWQTQVDQRLFEGPQIALRAHLLLLETLTVLPDAAPPGALLTSLGSGHAGHGLLLWFVVVCVKETMTKSLGNFKYFHGVTR